MSGISCAEGKVGTIFGEEDNMPSGRPPLGPQLVETLEMSAHARERLQLILETIAGTCSVKDASEKLGVSEARFHVLRRETLEAAAQSLEPKPAGRRPSPRLEEEARIEQLEYELREMKVLLEAMRLREEIAAITPQLLKGSCSPLSRSPGPRAFRAFAGKSGTWRS